MDKETPTWGTGMVDDFYKIFYHMALMEHWRIHGLCRWSFGGRVECPKGCYFCKKATDR